MRRWARPEHRRGAKSRVPWPPDGSVVFRQSTGKLLRVLPLAGLMAAVPALLVVVGLSGAGLAAVLAGALGLTFFGPILLILLWTIVRPNYLVLEADRLRFRLYSVEAVIPWSAIRRVTAGAGWPSLVFHDCEVSGDVRFPGLRPLGWVLAVPTIAVGLAIRRPIANLYPTTRRQLVAGFQANQQMFGFHYGLPTSLLDGATADMVAAMRRGLAQSQASAKATIGPRQASFE